MENSICDSCVEICKATHYRKSCLMHKEKRKSVKKALFEIVNNRIYKSNETMVNEILLIVSEEIEKMGKEFDINWGKYPEHKFEVARFIQARLEEE